MRTIIVRTLVASALLGTGWAAAKAQVSEPNFELVVDAPPGATTITCVRGMPADVDRAGDQPERDHDEVVRVLMSREWCRAMFILEGGRLDRALSLRA